MKTPETKEFDLQLLTMQKLLNINLFRNFWENVTLISLLDMTMIPGNWMQMIERNNPAATKFHGKRSISPALVVTPIAQRPFSSTNTILQKSNLSGNARCRHTANNVHSTIQKGVFDPWGSSLSPGPEKKYAEIFSGKRENLLKVAARTLVCESDDIISNKSKLIQECLQRLSTGQKSASPDEISKPRKKASRARYISQASMRSHDKDKEMQDLQGRRNFYYFPDRREMEEQQIVPYEYYDTSTNPEYSEELDSLPITLYNDRNTLDQIENIEEIDFFGKKDIFRSLPIGNYSECRYDDEENDDDWCATKNRHDGCVNKSDLMGTERYSPPDFSSSYNFDVDGETDSFDFCPKPEIGFFDLLSVPERFSWTDL